MLEGFRSSLFYQSFRSTSHLLAKATTVYSEELWQKLCSAKLQPSPMLHAAKLRFKWPW